MSFIGDDVLIADTLAGIKPNETCTAADRLHIVIDHVTARKLIPFAEVVIDTSHDLPVCHGSRDGALIRAELDVGTASARRDSEELRVRVSPGRHLLQYVGSWVDAFRIQRQ